MLGVLLLAVSSSDAFALFGGYEIEWRAYGVGPEQFLDLLSYEPVAPMRRLWAESSFLPGGPRGYRFNNGSTSPDDAWEDHELVLRYDINEPWTWVFRYFQGETLEGRYRHLWTGMRADLGNGWYWTGFGEPLAAKEFIDMGFAIGREGSPGAGDRVPYRCELRAIWPDLWHDEKNHVDANNGIPPFDLQVSLLAKLPRRGWISFEYDRDFPFDRDYGDNEDPLVLPEDENYEFTYHRWQAELKASIDLEGPHRLWLRGLGSNSDRGREHVFAADEATDWDAAHRLMILQAEWWRELAGGSEFGLGLEFAEMHESHIYPNAGDRTKDYWQDRTDYLLYVQYRHVFFPKFAFTTSVWYDFVGREHKPSEGTFTDDHRPQGKIGFAIEMPTVEGEVRGGRFILGASFQLDEPDFGGGYGQFVATF